MLKQDSVLERLMPALDLALGLRMIRRSVDMLDVLFGDAMNVRLDRGLWEALEFGPLPLAEHPSVELKRKSPLFEVDLRSRSRRKNREIRCHVLSGWDAVGQTLLSSSRAKAAGNRWHIHASAPFRLELLPGYDQA